MDKIESPTKIYSPNKVENLREKFFNSLGVKSAHKKQVEASSSPTRKVNDFSTNKVQQQYSPVRSMSPNKINGYHSPVKEIERSQSPQKMVTMEEVQESPVKMQQRLKFLYSHLGAVMRGYKTRRIYQNNKTIRKYRLEFREIIQFAYSLKKDLEVQGASHQSEEVKHLLVTSLKDLVSKRHQFSNYFNRLLCGEGTNLQVGNNSMTKVTDWIEYSKPRQVQPMVYKDIFSGR